MSKPIAAADVLTSDVPPVIPPLEPGDFLSRGEFERRYEAMPDVNKAELIEGMVHMASPVRLRKHGRPHTRLVVWLVNYELQTKGVEVGDNATICLDLDNELQPDALMIIHPASGGRVRISADDYIEGAPELVAEITSSTASIDMNTKLHVYRRNGVQEYIVWRVLDKEIDWFKLHEGGFQPLPRDASGCYRSTVFPGLWLDASALLRDDMATVLQALQNGLASPEHADFVKRLQRPPGSTAAAQS